MPVQSEKPVVEVDASEFSRSSTREEMDSLRAQIAHLQKAIEASKEDRVHAQLEEIKSALEKIDESLSKVGNQPIDLGPLENPLIRIDEKVTEIRRNVPPIATTVAAAAIVLGVVGWNIKDLVQTRESVSELSGPVTSVVDAMTKATSKSEELSASVATNLDELESTFDDARKLLGLYGQQITGSTSKISGLETKLASLSMEINLLLDQIDTHPPVALASVEQPVELGTDSLIEELVQQFNLDDEHHPVAYLMRAQKLLKQGNFSEARNLALQAKSMPQEQDKTVFDVFIAQTFFKERKFKDAVGAWQKALATADERESPSIVNNLATSYHAWAEEESSPDARRALLEKAAEYHARARQLAPEQPEVYANSSITLNALGRPEEARQVLEAYKGPESANVQYQLAATYALLNRPTDSLDLLVQALRRGGRTLALAAAFDSDFASMRADPEFKDVLTTHLGEDASQSLTKIWAEDQQEEDSSESPP